MSNQSGDKAVAFVQPFGLGSPGGGSRIIRSLIAGADRPVVFASTGPGSRATGAREVHFPTRRTFGRLEQTRLGRQFDGLVALRPGRLSRRLADFYEMHEVGLVHITAHDHTFASAVEAAERSGIPYVLTVHDDTRYILRRRVDLAVMDRRLARAWRQAAAVTVISNEMGEEYARRYGRREYLTVTDSVERIATDERVIQSRVEQVYFMGLLHLAYERNFQVLLDAVSVTGSAIRVTTRCGSIPLPSLASRGLIGLPFVDQEHVEEELSSQDFAYLPLPFGREQDAFARFSLSTKLVTYLASGVPILYHGPAYGPAYNLLAEHDAAVCVTSLDCDALARALRTDPSERRHVARNALRLAHSTFRAPVVRQRFWSLVDSVME